MLKCGHLCTGPNAFSNTTLKHPTGIMIAWIGMEDLCGTTRLFGNVLTPTNFNPPHQTLSHVLVVVEGAGMEFGKAGRDVTS